MSQVKRAWNPKKVSVHARVKVTLEYTCPVCSYVCELTLLDPAIVGGCSGHDPGEYCYCPMQHYEETTKCPGCGVTVELES